jgi:hypothetical protein
MAKLTTALIKFEDSKYNYCKQIGEHTSEDEAFGRYYDKEIGVRGYNGLKKCISVRFASVVTQVTDQVEFKAFYDDYMKHFTDQGIYAFCSNVRALSSWTFHEFKTDDCGWEFTQETVVDKHGLHQQIGIFQGHKFVLIDMDTTWIFQHVKNKVRGCNDGQYGRNNPIQKVGESFYNKDAQLIFYFNDKQKQKLQDEYESRLNWNKGWKAYNKVKKDISLTNWVECNHQVAWHFMESVPPVIFGLTRFLSGEAVDHTSKGKSIYQEFKQVDNDKWLTKYSTVQMFKEGK